MTTRKPPSACANAPPETDPQTSDLSRPAEPRFEADATSEPRESDLLQTREALRRRSHELGERIKELNCLYGIYRLVEQPDLSLEEIFEGVVRLIPPSWQYPHITQACIEYLGNDYRTPEFRPTVWIQSSPVVAGGVPVGTVSVCYAQECPSSDEGPFLKKERNLLDAVARHLGTIIERKQAEEALEESMDLYRTLAEHVADGVTLVQDGRFLFANVAFAAMLGCSGPAGLVGGKVEEIFAGERFEGIRDKYRNPEKTEEARPVFRVRFETREVGECWMEGYHHFLTWKGRPALLTTLRDITERRVREMAIREEAEQLRRENLRLRSSIRERYRFGHLVGKSTAMQEVYRLVLKASETDVPVVISGESGTGKELIARTVHEMSTRSDKPFVAVNCGAVPETLFESEFFGHRKGAFTGAYAHKRGFFDSAHGGSLFLDEISELTPNMQAKLLRALEGSGYIPVGGDRVRRADVRILAATNVPLRERVRKGLMREDFFYRLNVVSIPAPPLRERKEDIPLLVEHFLKTSAKNGPPRTIPLNVMDALLNYPWPGNVRELQNVVQRYVTLNRLDFLDSAGGDMLGEEDLHGDLEEDGQWSLREAMSRYERKLISAALSRTRWRRGKAAALLGVDRKTLFRKMKELGLG